MNPLELGLRFSGKLIGAVLGFVFSRGSWAGLLIGAFIGHTFDRRANRHHPVDVIRSTVAMQSQFSRAVFLIMGKLAKADAPVNEKELEAARQMMSALRLSEIQRQEAMALFSEGKQADFQMLPQLLALKEAIGRRAALGHFFIEMQLSVALVDGPMNAAEQAVLADVCEALSISTLVFNTIHRRVTAQFAFQKFHAQQKRGGATDALAQAYGVIGVSAESTDSEVKKAYRKLMSEHHPDKLVANGLPPEMENIAKEKSQEIQHAYSLIRKSRKTE